MKLPNPSDPTSRRTDPCTWGRSNRRVLSLKKTIYKHLLFADVENSKALKPIHKPKCANVGQDFPSPFHRYGRHPRTRNLQTIAATSPATHCAIFPVIAPRAAALVARQKLSRYQFQNLLSLRIPSVLSCCRTLHSMT